MMRRGKFFSTRISNMDEEEEEDSSENRFMTEEEILEAIATGIRKQTLRTRNLNHPLTPSGFLGKMKCVQYAISYYPETLLGKGSMGTKVYPGRFEQLRDIAVKRIDIDFYEFIENEMNLLSRSDSHPNVIRYISSEVENEFRYIALELCHANLVDWVEQNPKGRFIGPVNPVEILQQCANGLKYIHSKNIVHRDIKPSNILLKKDGDEVIAKITDFGLGKKLDVGKMSYTHSGRGTGTQGWKAAEVINSNSGDRMNSKVDVFALGCVFYYVLTKGYHPFGNLEDQTECQHNIRMGNHKRIIITEDTRGTGQLIEIMIAFDPERRPPISAVLAHPRFWKEDRIANFFYEVKSAFYDRRECIRTFILEFEREKGSVFQDSWIRSIPGNLLRDLYAGNRRNYNGSSLRDLIRAFRNSHAHFEELSVEVRMEIHTKAECVRFWLGRFPNLLPYTWQVFEVLKADGGIGDGEFYDMAYNFFQ